MSFVRTLGEVFEESMRNVYPPDDFDPPNTRTPIKISSLTMLISFLGLPSRELNGEQSLANFAQNFVGWQPDAAYGRKIFNLAKAIPTALWHLISFLPKLAINIVKLSTEFLPLMLMNLAYVASIQIESQQYSTGPGIKLNLLRLLKLLADAAYFLLMGLHFAGRAITSPMRGVYSAWFEGKSLGETISQRLGLDPASTTAKVISITAGVFASLTSLAITGTVYFFLFPAAAKFIAAKVLPALPSAIANAVTTVANFLSSALSAVGHFITTAALPFLGVAANAIGLSATVAGIGLSAGLIAGTIGTVVDRAITRFCNWWHISAKKVESSQVDAFVNHYDAQANSAAADGHEASLAVSEASPSVSPRGQSGGSHYRSSCFAFLFNWRRGEQSGPSSSVDVGYRSPSPGPG